MPLGHTPVCEHFTAGRRPRPVGKLQKICRSEHVLSGKLKDGNLKLNNDKKKNTFSQSHIQFNAGGRPEGPARQCPDYKGHGAHSQIVFLFTHLPEGVVTYSRPSVSVDVPAWVSWLSLDTCYEIQGV